MSSPAYILFLSRISQEEDKRLIHRGRIIEIQLLRSALQVRNHDVNSSRKIRESAIHFDLSRYDLQQQLHPEMLLANKQEHGSLPTSVFRKSNCTEETTALSKMEDNTLHHQFHLGDLPLPVFLPVLRNQSKRIQQKTFPQKPIHRHFQATEAEAVSEVVECAKHFRL